MGKPWIHWLTIVVSLLSAFTAHAVSIRIRDRTTYVEETNPSSGQFLREKIGPVVVSSPVETTTTQNPANLLLEYYTRTQVNPNKKTVIVSSPIPPPSSPTGVYTSLIDS